MQKHRKAILRLGRIFRTYIERCNGAGGADAGRDNEVLGRFVMLAKKYRLRCSQGKVAETFVLLRKLSVAVLR